MELGVKDVAKMLGLPELTIMRWIKQGKIPFSIKKGRYVFDKEYLISWAKMHHISLKEIESSAENNKYQEENITLYDAVKRGGVFFGIKGNNVEEVLRRAVELMDIPKEVDIEFLFEKLIQREELCSTGIGEGIAIPHPRHPIPKLKAMVSVFFLEKTIDFNSVDGKPVFIMFIILSPSTKIHLRLLSRLSFCLRKKEFLEFLKNCKNKEELLLKIKQLESEFDKK